MLSEHIKWKEAVAGAVSGALTVLLLHPLDLVKTRLQVQEKGFSHYRSVIHAFKTISYREGVRGLYSGAIDAFTAPSLLHSCAYNAWRLSRNTEKAMLYFTEPNS
jgi:hypothetical protein